MQGDFMWVGDLSVAILLSFFVLTIMVWFTNTEGR